MGKTISLPLYQNGSVLACELNLISLEMSIFNAGIGITGKIPTLSIRELNTNKILDFSDMMFKLSGDVVTPTVNLSEIGDGIYQYQINLNSISNIEAVGGFYQGLAILYKEATTPAIDTDYINFYTNTLTMLADDAISIQQAIKEILAYCNGEISRDVVTKINSYKDRQGNVIFTLEPKIDSRLRTDASIAGATAHYFNQMGVEIIPPPPLPPPAP